MTVYFRLTEFFFAKFKTTRNRLYWILAQYTKRRNEILNQFEHGFEHSVTPGTLFHHSGITINDGVKIDPNVQLFKSVTLALVNGKTCSIGENSIIFSHVIILGRKIGKNCIIGAGSVVTQDIPDNSIAVGVPARIVNHVEDTNKYLEFQ